MKIINIREKISNRNGNYLPYRRALSGILLLFMIGTWCNAADTIFVNTDYSEEFIKSKFRMGISHVNNNVDPYAYSRALTYLDDAVQLHNVHIMGWGTGNPNPAPGVYDWESLDKRVSRYQRYENSEVVITFCTAPGWMKTSGEDWEMNDRVADEHFDDFAELCRIIASRYPEVKYFQVWNEYKGFYGDDEPKYTEMYNAVYTAVKNERPDAIVGGLYKGFPDDLVNGGDLSSHSHELIDYWLENKTGADFICFDGWIQGWPNQDLPEETLMQNTACFGKLSSQISKKTDLPVWVSEYYGAHNIGDIQFQAANHASCYYHSLISGTSVGLHWGPFSFAPLFDNPHSMSGGEPTSHYHVIKMFNKHFGPGRRLYKTSCTDSMHLDALSTLTKTLLINKQDTSVSLIVNGQRVSLSRYEVRLIDRLKDLEMEKGDTLSLYTLLEPLDQIKDSLSWSVSDNRIVSIDDSGRLKALDRGAAQIRLEINHNGFTDSLKLEVSVSSFTPVTIRVNVSKFEKPHWFNTMFMADGKVTSWQFEPMNQDPDNGDVYYYTTVLEEGITIRPTFAFGAGWGTAENPPTCAQQGESNRTQVISADNNDFTFFWDEFDCTDQLDPLVQDAFPQAEILFSIKNRRSKVSPEILGQQLIYDKEADSLWMGPSAFLSDAIKALSPGIFRYPGGVVTNYYHWNNPTGTYIDDNWDPGYDPVNNAGEEQWMSIDEYFAFCKEMGTKPLLGINIESGLVYNREQDGIDEAVELVEYAVSNGFEGSYYYLGNEPWVKDKNGIVFTAEEYATHILSYAAEMRKADPGAQFVVSWQRYIAEKTEGLQKIFEIAGDYIDVVDLHWYWNTSQSSFTLWRNQQGMRTSAQKYTGGTYEEDAKTFKNLIAEWGYPDVKLASLEYNSGAGNTYTGPDTYQISLMLGEMLLQYVNGGVDMTCIWPMHFPFEYYAKNNNKRTLFDESRSFDKNAPYDLFYFLKEVPNQTLLGSRSDNPWIYSLVLLDSAENTVDIYLLNRADSVINAVLPVNSEAFSAEMQEISKVLHFEDGGMHRAQLSEGSIQTGNKQPEVELPAFSITRIVIPAIDSIYKKTEYSVDMIIRDENTLEPVSGCVLELNGNQSVTDETGRTEPDSLAYGIYSLSLSANLYHPKLINAIEIHSDTTLEFFLKPDLTEYSTLIKVIDRADREPVYRAHVGIDDLLKPSDPLGEVQFKLSGSGYHSISVEHPDYFSFLDTVNLGNDTIIIIELTRTHADIRFEVNNEEGPAADIPVTLENYTVTTDMNGKAFFNNQPAGNEYSYYIEKSGYQFVADTFFLEIDTVMVIDLEPVSSDIDLRSEKLRVLPNPAVNSSVTIEIENDGQARIEIFEITGKKIYDNIIADNRHLIPGDYFRSGIYLIKVETQKRSYIQKIIVDNRGK